MLHHKLHYSTRDDLHRAYAEDEHLKKLEKVWLELPSQRSGVTFNYLLILAGFQSVKPDRMVIRFIRENAELGDRRFSEEEAAALSKKVAELYPTEPRRLDHVTWRYVSGRDVFREEEVSGPRCSQLPRRAEPPPHAILPSWWQPDVLLSF